MPTEAPPQGRGPPGVLCRGRRLGREPEGLGGGAQELHDGMSP